MSLFQVTKAKISEIEPINGASSIELASIAGSMYTFIVKKDTFKVGDYCVYIPLDAVLPDALKDKLGLPDNRIKTYKLKKFGVISQGVLTDTSIIEGFGDKEDYAADLGIVKYEEPVIEATRFDMSHVRNSPVYVYDIESVQNYAQHAKSLYHVPVLITEKLEGTHWSMTVYNTGRWITCSRKLQVEDEASIYYKMGKKHEVDIPQLQEIMRQTGSSMITIRGEIVGPGIQNNYYKLDEHRLYVFEVDLDGQPADVEILDVVLDATTFFPVPLIAGYDYAYKLALFDRVDEDSFPERLIELSNGLTSIGKDNTLLREGIVIRPLRERFEKGLGRLILKVRSPEYLAKQT